jgi:hypothetical protein
MGIDTGKALKCGGALELLNAPNFGDVWGHPFVIDDSFVYGVVNGQLVRAPQ